MSLKPRNMTYQIMKSFFRNFDTISEEFTSYSLIKLNNFGDLGILLVAIAT